MQIDIDVRKIEKEGSRLVGFANVTFARKLRVDGIKLMKRKDGQIFLSMPSFKTNQKDENGKDIYKDICFPRVKEFKDDLTEAVLECYLGIGEEKSAKMTFGEPSGDPMQVGISVTPIQKEDSKIVGLASITLNNAFRINDIVIRKAKGKLPHKPIHKQAIQLEMAVAQKTDFASMPAADKMTGFKTIMLAQERKVVIPAMISVLTFVPLSVRWKVRSRYDCFAVSISCLLYII